MRGRPFPAPPVLLDASVVSLTVDACREAHRRGTEDRASAARTPRRGAGSLPLCAPGDRRRERRTIRVHADDLDERGRALPCARHSELGDALVFLVGAVAAYALVGGLAFGGFLATSLYLVASASQLALVHPSRPGGRPSDAGGRGFVDTGQGA